MHSLSPFLFYNLSLSEYDGQVVGVKTGATLNKNPVRVEGELKRNLDSLFFTSARGGKGVVSNESKRKHTITNEILFAICG